MEYTDFRLSAYLHRSCGLLAPNNPEENYVDHNYIRAPAWRPEMLFSKPARTLFVHPTSKCLNTDEEEEIDVESVKKEVPPVYESSKALALMEECEKHVNFNHPDEGNPDWEDHISKVNWSPMQSRLFNRVVRALQADRLARLSHKGRLNAPVLRRLSVDKTARRLRLAFAAVGWNYKYTAWLHNLLMDNLNSSLLPCYLEALQSLKSKVPSLVDRMLATSGTKSSLLTPNYELLNVVHKRPWDPLAGGIPRHKPRKLPRDPVLVMVPPGPGSSSVTSTRTHHWMANLSAMGTVVCVYSSSGRVAGKTTVVNCLDHMLATTRAKVTELRSDYENRPVILVGSGPGAVLACHVALVENVTAVVCLGFPMHTVEESRGTPDDSLLNLQVPILFVVGQHATTCSVAEMEEMRDKMNTMSSLVVVGGADDQLRMTKAKKTRDGITQGMLDKCIMDEVSDFLGHLLSPDYFRPVRPMIAQHPHPPIEPLPAKRVVKPPLKRKCDVAPHTPAKKGRKPKLSMVQKIVENKWGNQQPLTVSEVPRTPVPISATPPTPPVPSVTLTMTNSAKPVVLERKGGQWVAPSPPPPRPESTITVVAASSPTITAAATKQVKKRSVPGGQLTSLASVLQPGSRGSISPGSVTTQAKLTTDTAPILNEMNIQDIPVILGDQDPDELLGSVPLVSSPKSPVKYIITTPARGTPPSLKCTKILIKAPDKTKTVYLSSPNNGKRKP